MKTSPDETAPLPPPEVSADPEDIQRQFWREEVPVFYERIVHHVLDAFAEGKTPIIHGARGSGKTLQVAGGAGRQLDVGDNSVLMRSMEIYINGSNPIETLIGTAVSRFDQDAPQKFLFIDEAQVLVDGTDQNLPPEYSADPDRLAKLIRWGLDSNVQLAFVNAAVNASWRQQVNDRFSETLARLGAPEGEPVLVDVQLPPDFAVAWLQKHGANQDIVDLVSNPINKGALRIRAFDFLFVGGKVRSFDDLNSYFANTSYAKQFIDNMQIFGHHKELVSLLENVGLHPTRLQMLEKALQSHDFDAN